MSERISSYDPGQLSQAVLSDVKEFSERWLEPGGCFQKTARAPQQIINSVRHIEAFWDHLVSRSSQDETDQLLAASAADFDERIGVLQAELEAARDLHQRGRATLLSELCTRRQRAAGVEKASSSLMRPAQVTSAVADATAKCQQQAAAHGAVRLRPWLSKEACVEEGEVRLTLDRHRLLDLPKFDAAAPCCNAAAAATAAVWARFEAQKAAWRGLFEEEKALLETKIREVREQDEVDQKKHEIVVAALMARFEAHQEVQMKEAALGRRAPSTKKAAKDQGSLRASLLAGVAVGRPDSRVTPVMGASATIGRQLSGTQSRLSTPSAGNSRPASQATMLSPSGIRSGSSRPASQATMLGPPGAKGKMNPPELPRPGSKAANRNEIDKKFDEMRDTFGEPLSECSPTRQWGSMLVNQLGLNFHPTKPRGFDNASARCKKVPPRVARSLEEAFPMMHPGMQESEESMYLSRYMLGADRMFPGGCDRSQHLVSPPASATASTALPASASTSVVLR